MFSPKTERLKELAKLFPSQISELENILKESTHVYIDLANVLHWQNRLGWHIDFHKVKQFFDSFDTVKSQHIYIGTLFGNQNSEEAVLKFKNWGYDVHTKPVKIIRLSIDASSVALNSPALLQQFIRKPLLERLDLQSIEFLNQKLAELNKRGIFYIEDKKCNFDVEIGRNMLNDFEKNNVETFILWSTDSDFADPVSQILNDGKQAFIFATAGRVSHELDQLNVPIFEIKKIKEFICWPRELSKEIREKLEKRP